MKQREERETVLILRAYCNNSENMFYVQQNKSICDEHGFIFERIALEESNFYFMASYDAPILGGCQVQCEDRVVGYFTLWLGLDMIKCSQLFFISFIPTFIFICKK